MFALLLAAALGSPPVPAQPPLTPTRILGLIRAKFRSHRPPPPYETYVLTRKQNTSQGFPDYVNSYTYRYWYRASDHAALKRQVYRISINLGPMNFERPAFNEEEDPGPPTADLFEPAPVHPHPVTFVPTPEPSSPPRLIGVVRAVGEFDYRVASMETKGNTLHLSILPTRDPDRNRLRELYVDKNTYELQKVVATDKLFILGSDDVYGTTFTISLSMLDGIPVVTDIHGVVGDGYSGDGATVDYTFRNITFPTSLPAWYFDPHQYRAHQDNPPSS